MNAIEKRKTAPRMACVAPLGCAGVGRLAGRHCVCLAGHELRSRELEAALVGLGMKAGALSPSMLAGVAADLEAGKPSYVPVGGERLGRCYYRSIYLVLGDEARAPRGNSGGYTVLARGRHPLLGPWARTVCETDSSDQAVTTEYPRVLCEVPYRVVWFLEDDGALHWCHLADHERGRQ